MRSRIITLLSVGFLFNFCALAVFAQDEEPKSQLFLIHHDYVKPAMVQQYEGAVKGMIAKITANNMTTLRYTTAVTNDLDYLFVHPIANMAALDENPWKDLEKKMGEEAMKAMWKPYDNTYYKHESYLVRLWPDLSYTPANAAAQTEEMNFRHWEFYYVDPDKGDEARQIAQEWHDLYKSKNVPTGYRLYTGGLGTDVPLYVAVSWAKSPADFYAQNQKNMALLGDEGKNLMAKTMAITRKYEEKDGWIRPDLSYMPETDMTAK